MDATSFSHHAAFKAFSFCILPCCLFTTFLWLLIWRRATKNKGESETGLQRVLRQPAYSLVLLFCISLTSVYFAFVIPGYFAKQEGVFFADQIKTTFKKNKTQAPEIQKYFEESVTSDQNLKMVDEQIRSRLGPGVTELSGSNVNRSAESSKQPSLLDLFALRTKLIEEKNSRKPVLIGFWKSSEPLLWFDTFVSLGVMALLFSPTSVKWNFTLLLGTIGTGVAILAFYQWPIYMRAYLAPDPDIRSLAYNTLQMRPATWACLSGVIGLDLPYCLLLAVIWRQWIQYSRECEDKLIAARTTDEMAFMQLLSPERGEDFLNQFIQWVIASLLLGLSFIFDGFYYYGTISVERDARYNLDACLDLVVWGVSWLIISMPLIMTAKDWRQIRIKAIRQMCRDSDFDKKLKFIEEAKPLSTAVLVAAQIGAVVSFVAAVVQQVFK